MPAPPRLVPIPRVALAMADFLLLREPLPEPLRVRRLRPPLLPDQLRDVRVREPRVLRRYVRLVRLSVQDECCSRGERFAARLAY